MARSHRHLPHLLYRFPPGSRAETPSGSQLACAPGDGATRIRPTTGRPALCPTPIPAPPSVGLTIFLPSFARSATSLPRSTRWTRTGEVRSVRRECWVSVPGEGGAPVPTTMPFWPKPISSFGLCIFTTFIESAPGCTIPPLQPPRHRMLVEAPCPCGCGAGRVTVGSMSVGM